MPAQSLRDQRLLVTAGVEVCIPTGEKALLSPRWHPSSGSGAPADLRPRPGRPPSLPALSLSAACPGWSPGASLYASVLSEGPSDWLATISYTLSRSIWNRSSPTARCRFRLSADSAGGLAAPVARHHAARNRTGPREVSWPRVRGTGSIAGVRLDGSAVRPCGGVGR